MFDARILCSARGGLGLVALMSALAGCGQRGPLYLPTDAAAAGRATLPQVLIPTTPSHPSPPLEGEVAPGAPGTAATTDTTGGAGTGTASPVRNP